MADLIEVFDCMFGRPAAGVAVALTRDTGAAWEPVDAVVTDESGRAPGVEQVAARGRYRLSVGLDRYYATLGVEPLQSRVEVVFRAFHSGENVRFRLMVSPSSCAVYRLVGSGAANGDARQ